ncbi:MFS transporter [Caballeronia ptereochthonis]|uniref:MFS transporter n=1 Tax=Caballeronia ptereochthonis TaxID=1777144 RepID=UPI001FC9FBBB|nr:MFS transporter [Caballeronia ptereochthonis]
MLPDRADRRLDQVAAAFAAPALTHAWHTNATGFVRVYGVGLFGVLVGSLLLGVSGERFGRKLMIIYGSLWSGVLTFMCGYADSLGQLTLLRFLAGIGICRSRNCSSIPPPSSC